MAINPIFGSQLPDLARAGAQASVQTSTSAPTMLSPEQLSAEAADVLLSDLNANASTTSGDSLLSLLDPSAGGSTSSSFTGAPPASGDPLLDDLNALDAGQQANASSVAASLGQNLNSFLLQQAAASFQASQAMDSQGSGSSPSGNVLGNTRA
jgi:hypothetical protein